MKQFDIPSTLTSKKPKKSILIKQQNMNCFSTYNTGFVKTSIKGKKQYPGISNLIRFPFRFLIQDVFYLILLYFSIFKYDLESLKILLIDLIDDQESHKEILTDRYANLLNFHFQLIVLTESLIYDTENSYSNDSINFCPNFNLLISDYFFDTKPPENEPEPPSLIAPLIKSNWFSKEHGLILQKKLYLGINPSEPDIHVIMEKPIEFLIAWIVGCHFTNTLDIGCNKTKSHREKSSNSETYEKKEDLARPVFYTLLRNHVTFFNRINNSTIHRNCECIYDYFLRLHTFSRENRKTLSTKNELIHYVKMKPPVLLAKIQKQRSNNITTACSLLPEDI